MTQHSEDRIDAATPEPRNSARILPFERPQSELQRAVQQRAQEALDIERDRDREAKRPAPLRWLIIFLLAAAPVLVMVLAVDGFLRAFHRVNQLYNAEPPPAAAPAPPTSSESATPDVVILQPYESNAAAPVQGEGVRTDSK